MYITVETNLIDMDFKKITWQQWTGFGLVVALVITMVVLHLVQPTISYAFAECMTAVGTALGAVAGYLLGRKKDQTKVQGSGTLE